MLASLALTVALAAPAAPVPVPPAGANAPAAGSRPPRLLDLKPDADGKVRVPVLRAGNAPAIGAPQGPGAAPVPRANPLQRVELFELKDLQVKTAGGKTLSKEEAQKALANG